MKRTQHIAYFKVPYKQKDNDNYQNNDNFCCGDKKSSKGDGVTDNEDPELNQFYYHSDHLGSSSYITNLKGSIVQHIEYVPFGEVFIEERNNKWNTPYLFNGKELDEETGLYYYGARYYSSRNSIFLSVDPLWEAKPSFSPYAYTMNNPLKFTDPTGMLEEDPPTKKIITAQKESIPFAGENYVPSNDMPYSEKNTKKSQQGNNTNNDPLISHPRGIKGGSSLDNLKVRIKDFDEKITGNTFAKDDPSNEMANKVIENGAKPLADINPIVGIADGIKIISTNKDIYNKPQSKISGFVSIILAPINPSKSVLKTPKYWILNNFIKDATKPTKNSNNNKEK